MKVDCRQLCDLLFDYINGDLPDDKVELLEKHLKLCPPCLVHVETYRVTVTLTRKLRCRELSPECEKRLREALARECSHRLSSEPEA